MSANNPENKESVTTAQNKGLQGVTSSTTWERAVELISSTGPRSFAVALGVLYAAGFLVVNAYLNRYGVFDLDIANARYLAAGSVYSFYLVMFMLGGGRGVVLIKNWMRRDINFIRATAAKEWWALLAFTHSFIHLAFLLCLSAAAFSAIAFAGSETFFFFGFLGFAFLVDYSMDVSNLDVRYPRFHLIVQFAIKIPAIVVFFALAENAKPIVVFVSYLSIALYINLVLDHFERYRITSDNVIFTTMYAVVFFLATAVSFGALVYGDVSRKIGGGRYMEANIALTKEFSGLFDGEGQSPPESEVKVIHVTDKHMFIEVNGKTIRIPESAVKWLVLKKPG